MTGTTGKENRLQALANMISAQLEAAPPRPKLRLVRREDLAVEPKGMDAATRDLHYRIIRDLAHMYTLGWLVRQETEHVGGTMELLGDDELRALRDKLDQARECLVEGIAFDDAGLVRQRGEQWGS